MRPLLVSRVCIWQVNVFQTKFVYVKMLRTVHKDGGTEIVDVVHYLIVQKLSESVEWQVEAPQNKMTFDALWDRLMTKLGNNATLAAVTDMSTTHARDIKMPHFARWMAIFPVLDLFLDNWTINHFIAVAIKQAMPASSGLSQYACTLIGSPGAKLSKGQCPVIYAGGLFVCAFEKPYLIRNFEWLLRHDPEFEKDSYGQSI